MTTTRLSPVTEILPEKAREVAFRDTVLGRETGLAGDWQASSICSVFPATSSLFPPSRWAPKVCF